jgi:protein-S-isoprenylcysteine O-methyltransferase Ste14
MKSSFVILLASNLACYAIRTIYELYKRAGRVNLKNKALFALIFAAMCVIWVSWFVMCSLDPWELPLPQSLRWMGLGIFLIGWCLALGALIQLKGLEDIDHLVTTGLFSKLRHPMYTGFILWILGWSTYHAAGVSLIAGIFGIANVLFWRGLEDKALLALWGDRYAEYRKGTWF